MHRNEMRTMGIRMLNEARALRAAFPDASAMQELPVSPALPESPGEDKGVVACRAALGYLRDEMLLVRAGKADSLTVLDDEIAYAESLVRRL